MNYALWFFLGFFTCSFAGRVMQWQAKRAMVGDSPFSEKLRTQFIATMDHDRLLGLNKLIQQEIERRKAS